MAELTKTVDNPLTKAAFMAGQLQTGGAEPQSHTEWLLKKPIGKLLGETGIRELQRQIRAADEEVWDVNGTRKESGGLDADLHALRSVSLVNKMRIQNERHRQNRAILAAAKEFLDW